MNRAVAVDHLFVLGLGEGELPRPTAPDPLYTPAERATHPLPLARVGSAEDASLWWQVLCNCQCSLMLLRSRYDANGAEWQASPYWDAVIGVVEGLADRVDRPALSARSGIDEAASYGELLEALAIGGAATAPAALAGQWKAVQAAREVAAARAAWGAPGRYEGIVSDADILAVLNTRYGPRRAWSVSRLNQLGVCAYAFWAQQALRLEALADPAEGFDALQRGSLVHKLLERLFARMKQEGVAPGPETGETVSVLLDKVCDELLPLAAGQYGFRPGPLWDHEQAELRRELRAYMAWECQPEQAGAFRPFVQELKFGMGTSDPVIITGRDGAQIALRGVIDRIDADGAGHLRVVDYKTGSKKITGDDIAAGRMLQSALYAWMAEALASGEGVVIRASYRHTGKRYESGIVEGGPAQQNEVVVRASAKAVELAQAAVSGWFPASPSRGSGAKACDERCDYLGLCRVTRHGVRKARVAGAPLVAGVQSAESEPGSGQGPDGGAPWS
jgi:RecB family exonuclease